MPQYRCKVVHAVTFDLSVEAENMTEAHKVVVPEIVSGKHPISSQATTVEVCPEPD